MLTIEAREFRQAGLACVALTGAIAVSWAGSLGASFQFDDWNVVVGDPRVQSLAAWWHSLPGIRPLLKLSYALNHEIGGGARGFRVFNICVHALNAILLFGLFRRRARATKCGAALLVAATAAVLFALEPVQTEAVTYISGRSSSLAALPCLAALRCWELALERPSGIAMHAAGVTCYVIALLIKETAWVLPLAIVLWHHTRGPHAPSEAEPGGRPDPWRPVERRALLAYGAISILAVTAALTSTTYGRLLRTSLHERSIAENLSIQAEGWGFLCRELVRLAGLNADPQLAQVIGAHGHAGLLWGLFWLLLLSCAWAVRRRAPQVTFGVLWFYLWLLPTNSLLPRLDVANDRQLYLALAGPAWLLALALGWVVARVHSSAAQRALGWSVPAVFALVLGMATVERNRVYATEIVFWQDVLIRGPTNARAANNLGIAYALSCRDAAAASQFTRAIALDPDGFRARVNLRLLRAQQLTRRDGSHCRLLAP